MTKVICNMNSAHSNELFKLRYIKIHWSLWHFE